MSSYIDLILLVFLIYSAYQGYQVGFLTSLSKLLFFLVGILFSLFLAFQIKGLLYPGLINSPYIAIGILALIITAIVRKFLKQGLSFLQTLLKKTDLMWVDPILGAALAVMKSYVVIYIFISVLGSFNNPTIMNPIHHSKVAQHMYNQVRSITSFNLMGYIRSLSLKKVAHQAGEQFEKSIDMIEKA